jgi:hypothetical protein
VMLIVGDLRRQRGQTGARVRPRKRFKRRLRKRSSESETR